MSLILAVSDPNAAYGPLAGVAPKPGDDWRSYRAASSASSSNSRSSNWLQAAPWKETESSAMGAGLRIAYVLDYGDYQEIASGQPGTDYDVILKSKSGGETWRYAGYVIKTRLIPQSTKPSAVIWLRF